MEEHKNTSYASPKSGEEVERELERTSMSQRMESAAVFLCPVQSGQSGDSLPKRSA